MGRVGGEGLWLRCGHTVGACGRGVARAKRPGVPVRGWRRYSVGEGRAVLVAIRLLHTIIWAFFAACIVALPLAAFWGRLDWAVVLTLAVLVECGVLAVNRGRCPLTVVAARYTDNRADNFDIYLPVFIARHNKVIFGTLFVFGVALTLWRWLTG